MFVSNVMSAVHKHNALLKASIMSATNAHRLGANEAPPAIISMFLGSQLTQILDSIEKNETDSIILEGKEGMRLDVSQIPDLLIDNTDRNRTSPFAFTGNRFEYRAVGSSANCASALIALNAAVAVELDEFADACGSEWHRERILIRFFLMRHVRISYVLVLFSLMETAIAKNGRRRRNAGVLTQNLRRR